MKSSKPLLCIRSNRTKAFTIVELLIVVVVIGILAAITIVAYNGISTQAKEAALKTDLNGAVKQLGVAKVTLGSYPGDTTAVKKSDTTTLTYTSGADTFCLQASSSQLPGKTFYATEAGLIQEGVCPAGTPTTMNSMTSAYCATMAVYTGSNPGVILNLTDNRDGTTRTYEVAKLADNKCWMLANLKLGSTTSAILLTPSNSNVASNFTLPQLTTSGTANYDLPRAYGPVTGDTGSGATNYGYLYNWSAATAGESSTTKPAGGSNANYSICPANWRLANGGSSGGEFALLNAKMNNSSATAPSMSGGAAYSQNWRPTGPFKGVSSGYWSDGFYLQTNTGYVWSSSVHGGTSSNAYSIEHSGAGLYPDTIMNRGYGLGVRCVLN